MGELQAKQSALKSPETLATVAHAIIRKQYGEDAYEWSPTTIYLELQADFTAEPDGAVLDRWSAMSVIMTSDAFFKRIDAFMGICNTLSSGEPFFQIFDPVTVEEAAWAITEVSLNRELLPFSYPIRQYLKQILKADGYPDGAYPTVFEEAMELTPSAEDIRRALQKDPHNSDNVEAYINEQLKDLTYQFNKIPDLRDLDDIILQRSMDEFVGNVVNKVV
jgi:hypothetical protein